MKRKWKPVLVLTNVCREDYYFSRNYRFFGVVLIGSQMDDGHIMLECLRRNQGSTYRSVENYIEKRFGVVFA